MRLLLRPFVALALLAVLPTLALAGPPLICHPFDIGTARSLPIGPADGGWSATDPTYDRSQLVADTLALLTPATPTLVRMETMRRATMYVEKDEASARRLLAALQERAASARAGRDAALARFDVGYLVETYRQLSGPERPFARVIGSLDGYAMASEALRVVQDDPAMHFAAALMTMGGSHASAHAKHVRAARDAAGRDVLLAKNVRTHLRDA